MSFCNCYKHMHITAVLVPGGAVPICICRLSFHASEAKAVYDGMVFDLIIAS